MPIEEKSESTIPSTPPSTPVQIAPVGPVVPHLELSESPENSDVPISPAPSPTLTISSLEQEKLTEGTDELQIPVVSMDIAESVISAQAITARPLEAVVLSVEEPELRISLSTSTTVPSDNPVLPPAVVDTLGDTVEPTMPVVSLEPTVVDATDLQKTPEVAENMPAAAPVETETVKKDGSFSTSEDSKITPGNFHESSELIAKVSDIIDAKVAGIIDGRPEDSERPWSAKDSPVYQNEILIAHKANTAEQQNAQDASLEMSRKASTEQNKP